MSRPKKSFATPEELNQFERFLFEMDDSLERFCSQALRRGFNLDFSLESLERLEKWILLEDHGRDNLFDNRAARYLGELFRKNIGGRWELCLKSPKYLYFKQPVVTGYSDHPIEFCPMEIIANFKAKRRDGMLREALDSHRLFKN